MFLQVQVCSSGPEHKSTAMFRCIKGTGDTEGTRRAPPAAEERSQLDAVMSQLTAASFCWKRFAKPGCIKRLWGCSEGCRAPSGEGPE